jgi:hypothetical protein
MPESAARRREVPAGADRAARVTLYDVATLGSYALAVVGFVMMAVAVARTLSSNLKYIYTRPLLINALRTNANHAERLCKTAPESYFGAIGAALKTAGMVQSRDPKIIPTATLPAYDAAGTGIAMGWKTLLGKVKLGLMAAGGAIALGLTKGVPAIPVIILAAGVGIGFLWLFSFKAEVERTIVLARAEILPEVNRAVAEGRYVFPPPPAG